MNSHNFIYEKTKNIEFLWIGSILQMNRNDSECGASLINDESALKSDISRVFH
jgi:hypothetical protein